MSEEPRESVYGFQEDIETLERYRDGGYHPVQLGDDFSDGRYRVIHKLGWGSYSTVWLAKDQHMNSHVALKIIVGEEGVSSNESRILRLLKQHQASTPASPGAHSVPELLDEFTIHGPNGRHQCFVSEPAACSVADSKEAGLRWQFPLKLAREIAAKVIMGIDFIHSAGIVHGDLHTRNIFFKISDVNGLSTGELYQRLKPPTIKPVQRVDKAPLGVGVPPYAVEPLWIGKGCEEITNTDLMIADFGEAYVAKEKSPETLNTPVILCPPEMLLKIGTIGMPADIWALACAIFEILGKNTLFECWPDSDDTMQEIVSAIGKPSETLWKAWQNRHESFNEDGSWKPSRRGTPRSSRPLDMRISQMRRGGDEDLTKTEQGALLQLLEGMLTWGPEERFTIADVVHSEWMEQFGRPAIAVSGAEESVQFPTETDQPAIAALGTELSLQSKPAVTALGTEGSLQSSTKTKKSPYERRLEESIDIKIERLDTPTPLSCTETKKSPIDDLHGDTKDLKVERLETPTELCSTETEKSPYERLLEESKDLKIERLETITESTPTRNEKSANEDMHEGAKTLKVERLETLTELSSTETKKSPYERLLEESQDLQTERLETPAESSTSNTEKSPNEDSPEEAKNLEAERIVKPTK